MSAGSKPNQFLAAGHLILVLFAMCVALAGSATGAEIKTLAKNETTSLSDAETHSLPIKIHLVDPQDIRFGRLSKSGGLSQTRVASVLQDKLGFIWFGTQYGLNRCDGYTSKVFKHELGHSDSLSCVYIRSLFVDHSGTLWVGCDRFLDKYEPITETFAHYPVDTQVPGSLPTPIERINEDDAGMLWLATEKGLYKFDPVTGESTRYTNNPADPTSIAGNDGGKTGRGSSG